MTAFAVCPSGLETLALQELLALPGISEAETGRGGVHFRASAESIARANLWCRIPTRILLLVDQFRLRKPDDLIEAARRVQWERFITPNETIRVDVNQGRPPSFGMPLNLANLKIKDGLCDRMRELTGRRPSVDTQMPDLRVWAYLDGEKGTLSIDTSGEPLFKRGWRLAKGEAPLRENLAAALVQWAGWTDQSPLVDPFCGSGTLLIEAVAHRAGLAPGFHPKNPRPFACEGFVGGSPFGRVDFLALRQECARAWQAADEIVLPRVVGRDLNDRLVQSAQQNAERALPPALAAQMDWEVADFFETPPPDRPDDAQGLMVSNPPYGRRLQLDDRASAVVSDESLDEWRRLSEVLKRQYAGYAVWLLSDNLKLDTALRLKPGRRVPVYNGDLECRWMRFDMVAGSARLVAQRV